MLNFFVEDSPQVREIANILRKRGFCVKLGGFAKPNEIAFFYEKDQEKGFFFAAHKMQEGQIPDSVCATPFLICVGDNWKEKGLMNICFKYFLFLTRGLPAFDVTTMSTIRVLNICKRCIELPWGSFPKSKEGGKKLVTWLGKAQQALLYEEEKFNTERLTANR